ncbi:SH3 domain-containing protein [Falsiroseomonas sp. HW251]
MSGAVVWTAPLGTRLQIVGQQGVWLNVTTPGGEHRGWIHRSLLRDP